MSAVHLSTGHGVIAHPVVQTFVAGLTVAAWGTTAGTIAATMAIVYYLYLFGNAILSTPAGWIGSVISKAQALWAEDKPYFVMLAGLGFAASQYFHYPIPDWLLTGAMFLGLGTFHSYAKGKSNP